MPIKSVFAGLSRESHDKASVHNIPTDIWKRMNLKERCEVLGFRNDVMCLESVDGRASSKEGARFRAKTSIKKVQQEEEPHFYGGADMYSGPFGPQ
jgi:hypothetical protein